MMRTLMIFDLILLGGRVLSAGELRLKKSWDMPSASNSRHAILSSDNPEAVLRPATVEDDEGIRFFAPDGSPGKVAAWPKTYGTETINQTDYSKDGKHILLHTTTRGERTGSDDRITVYDTTGEVAWSGTAAYGSHYLAPNGQYAVCLFPGTGTPRYPPVFLDKSGIRNPAIVTFEFASSKKWYPRSSAWPIVFSDDSLTVAVGVSDVVARRHKAAIIIFDAGGNILSRIQTTADSIDNLAISPRPGRLASAGSRIASPSDAGADWSQIALWDTVTARPIWQTAVPISGYYLAFAPSGERLLAASGRLGEAFYFEASTGKLIWKFSPPAAAKKFTFKSALVADGRIVLTGEDRSGPNGQEWIFVLSEQGRIVGQKSYSKGTLRRYRNDHVVRSHKGHPIIERVDGADEFDIVETTP